MDEYIIYFSIAELKIGLFIKDVYRVIRAVDFTPLPGAPEIVQGIVNIEGKILPVVNFRKRFQLKEKNINQTDKIIIVKSEHLDFCFFSDDVIDLKLITKNHFLKSDNLVPGTDKLIEGITLIEDEIILIHDVNKFLSLGEEKQIKKAIDNASKH